MKLKRNNKTIKVNNKTKFKINNLNHLLMINKVIQSIKMKIKMKKGLGAVIT